MHILGTVHMYIKVKVKRSTQNDFVYGELGRIDFQCMRYFNIIIYW